MKNYLSSTSLKSQAKGQLLGKYGILAGTYAIHALCVSALSGITSLFLNPGSVIEYIIYFAVSFLISIFSGLFSYGEAYIYLKTSCRQQPVLSDLFYGFKQTPDRIIRVAVVFSLISYLLNLPVFLLSLLPQETLLNGYGMLLFSLLTVVCAVIGMLLMLTYSQSYYLLLDFPDCSAREALRKSRDMMKGSKGRLFYIDLTFVPLMLLCVLTCGIGLLWLMPYMQATKANFYLDLVKQN